MQGVAFEGSDTDGRHQACSSLFSIIKESSFPTPQPDLPSLHVILLTLFCPPLPLFSPLDGIYRQTDPGSLHVSSDLGKE